SIWSDAVLVPFCCWNAPGSTLTVTFAGVNPELGETLIPHRVGTIANPTLPPTGFTTSSVWLAMPDLHRSGLKTMSCLDAASRFWEFSDPIGRINTPLSEAEYITARLELSTERPARF